MNFDRFLHRTLGRPYRLHAAVHGDAAKPVIVLLHGIAASSQDWSKLIPLLEPYYRCVTIDLLGFADSPKPQWASYTMEDHGRAIEYTIRKLGIGGPFMLVGHSLGSLLATDYARRHQDNVERLLLLSPPVYPPLHAISDKLALRRTNLLLNIYKFLRTNPRVTLENVKRLALILPLSRSITKFPDTWLPFFRSLEHCIEQQTIIQDIKDIAAPIDVFYGTLDTVVVGENVRALGRLRDVTFHQFAGNHQLSARYAKVVAKVLLPQQPANKRRLPNVLEIIR